MLLKLDRRLQLCADLVRNGSAVADIGTDHAYLPVWLCENQKITKAIAADINELPLLKGRQTIISHHLEHCIETRLSDGLEAINENEAEDIVIAGMGGELIATILAKTPWVKNPKYHLILQPMTKAEKLREYLYSHGFTIQNERCTCADKKLYTVMSVYYSGEVSELSDMKIYCGKINARQSDENYRYLFRTAEALLKKGNGILSSDPDSKDGRHYLCIARMIFDDIQKRE